MVVIADSTGWALPLLSYYIAPLVGAGLAMIEPWLILHVLVVSCVAGAAIYGCLYLAKALKHLSVKRPAGVVLVSLLGSVATGWGFVVMIVLCGLPPVRGLPLGGLGLDYFIPPFVGAGLGTIPAWLILHFSRRRRRAT